MKCINMFILFSCVLTVWLHNVSASCPTIISKKQWNGSNISRVQYLSTPIDLVIIQHTVTHSCSNDQTCVEVVRNIQKIHMEESFLWDIGPSFLVASTGKVYEGRGWDHVAIHTAGFNNQSIGIAFIGNFNNQEPSVKALDAARALIQCGVEEERLSTNHHVVVHSQLLNTTSPGVKLASKVKLWPDWIQNVTEILKLADVLDNTNLPEINGIEDQVPLTIANVKSRPKRDVLTTTKDIDQLSNLRDVIFELLDNLRKLALQTLNTIGALLTGLHRQVTLFIDQLKNTLRRHKEEISFAADTISMITSVGHCVNPLKKQADDIYDNTEATIKSCADLRVKEIDDMIKNLGTLSSNVINFANDAVGQTRNCTELNFGIEPTTKACLNSVTTHIKSASTTYESQRAIALKTIQTSLNSLPAALDLCAKKHLLNAASETNNLGREIINCRPSLPFRW